MSRFQRGGPAFTKPENALKRSEELIAVGQPHAALQALHDVITSKRHRTWQKILETIMFKYVDLCVELKKGRFAKDGLIHYRNVCQLVNVQSLEEVIKYFLKTATDRAEAATASADAVTLDVDDLEQNSTPEDLMLSFVSSERGKDRTDRELVTPWFKFLWETYRTTLDILRNNSRLEALYAMTAARAFGFCLTYKRTTEFRRLCDILRNHLANLNKWKDQRDRPDLSIPESLQMYLETRFEQLRVACDLELWQEAFRSVEDIQGLMALGHKAPKTQMMAVYYARLTRIFTVSGNHLYNGYAWYKLFNLAKTYNKNLTQSDVQGMASSVLLAGLAIPPYDAASSAQGDAAAELEHERSMRMASILGFSVDAKRDARGLLSRGSLLGELQGKGILNLVPPEVKAIHALLEQEFNPLELCLKLAPLLEGLEKEAVPLSSAAPVGDCNLGQYRAPLQRVAIAKMLHQLSQVYSVMRVDALAALVPFATLGDVEQIIVDAIKHNFLAVRIDHKNGTLRFGADQLEGDRIRDHIAAMAKRLTNALTLINPAVDPAREKRRLVVMEEARESAASDNKRALARKVIIERRKEEQERLLLERERAEEETRLMQQRYAEAKEEERRREEMVKREEERIGRELAAREMVEAVALIEASKKKGKGIKLKEGEKLDKDALMREALTGQIKERAELEKKLAGLAKRMDHFERAKREEESPHILAAHSVGLQEGEKVHEAAQIEAAAQHRVQWEADVVEAARLTKMGPQQESFRASVMARRQEEFQALKTEREEKMAEVRAMRKQEREFNRKKEYARRCRIQAEEMRAEAHEAELARVAEQQAREAAERQRKLEEAAAKQRAKEEEVERLAKEAREKLLASAPPRAAAAAPAAASAAAAAPARSGGYVPPVRRSAAPAAAAGSDRPRDAWRPSGGDRGSAPAAEGASRGRDEAQAAPWKGRGGAEEAPRTETEVPASGAKWGVRRDREPAAAAAPAKPREAGPIPPRASTWSGSRGADRERAPPPARGGGGW